MKGGWCTGREFKCFPPWAVLFIMISFEGGYSPTKMFFLPYFWQQMPSCYIWLGFLFTEYVFFFPALCCSLGLNGAVINVITGLLSFCLSYISKTRPHGSSKPLWQLTNFDVKLVWKLFLRFSFLLVPQCYSVFTFMRTKCSYVSQHQVTAGLRHPSPFSLFYILNWNSPQNADKPR